MKDSNISYPLGIVSVWTVSMFNSGVTAALGVYEDNPYRSLQGVTAASLHSVAVATCCLQTPVVSYC